MQVGQHTHVIRSGDQLRCTICHRQWQTDEEADMEATACNPEPAERTIGYDRSHKRDGWRGPGDHGKTRYRTRRL